MWPYKSLEPYIGPAVTAALSEEGYLQLAEISLGEEFDACGQSIGENIIPRCSAGCQCRY